MQNLRDTENVSLKCHHTIQLQSCPKKLGHLSCITYPPSPLINVGKHRVFSNRKEKITCLSTLKMGGGENLLCDPTLGYCVSFSALFLTFSLFHDQFVPGNQKAQKYLLGAFELLVGRSFPTELMPKAAHILKAFYDHDLLEEEVILQWSEKVHYVDNRFYFYNYHKILYFLVWHLHECCVCVCIVFCPQLSSHSCQNKEISLSSLRISN